MNIDATNLVYEQLNRAVREAEGDVVIDHCLGQRFIGAGRKSGRITVNGTPGNALGAYLDGASIFVNGSGQDAVGDTMNDGSIVVFGSVGDAPGYAMRGGRLYVRGNSGYRTGIHMKEYQDKKPVIIVGGTAGSFLGEYLAGGIIVVLNLEGAEKIVGNFTGTGMHGGKIFLRCDRPPQNLPRQVVVSEATPADLAEIRGDLDLYRAQFGTPDVSGDRFYVLKPNAANPYKQLYVAN